VLRALKDRTSLELPLELHAELDEDDTSRPARLTMSCLIGWCCCSFCKLGGDWCTKEVVFTLTNEGECVCSGGKSGFDSTAAWSEGLPCRSSCARRTRSRTVGKKLYAERLVSWLTPTGKLRPDASQHTKTKAAGTSSSSLQIFDRNVCRESAGVM